MIRKNLHQLKWRIKYFFMEDNWKKTFKGSCPDIYCPICRYKSD